MADLPVHEASNTVAACPARTQPLHPIVGSIVDSIIAAVIFLVFTEICEFLEKIADSTEIPQFCLDNPGGAWYVPGVGWRVRRNGGDIEAIV